MNEQTLITKKQFVRGCLCALFVVGVVILKRNWPVNKLVVCDVGQGDGLYMRLKDGTDIVIDTGPDEKFLECLGREMAFMDHEIDFLFISHAHVDHYGGLGYVLERYTIKHIYIVPVYSGSKTFEKHIRRAREISDVKYVSGETDLKVNESVTFQIIWPAKRWLQYQPLSGRDLQMSSGDLNAFSLIIHTQIEGISVLLTGDAPSDNLKQALLAVSQPIAIIKAPHHGSSTSLNDEILDMIQPQIVLISAGKNNRYRHPSTDVINSLKKLRIPYMMTMDHGDMRIEFSARRWSLRAGSVQRSSIAK